MNRRKLLNHIIEILTAERDGIEIEYLPIERTTWMNVSAVDTENLIKHPDRYRIKPEPKLRPWKPEELPVGAQFKLSVYQGKGWSSVLSVDDYGVWLGRNESRCSFDTLLTCFVHSTDGGKTWKECGVYE